LGQRLIADDENQELLFSVTQVWGASWLAASQAHGRMSVRFTEPANLRTDSNEQNEKDGRPQACCRRPSSAVMFCSGHQGVV
jgi:hypothetical protein